MMLDLEQFSNLSPPPKKVKGHKCPEPDPPTTWGPRGSSTDWRKTEEEHHEVQLEQSSVWPEGDELWPDPIAWSLWPHRRLRSSASTSMTRWNLRWRSVTNSYFSPYRIMTPRNAKPWQTGLLSSRRKSGFSGWARHWVPNYPLDTTYVFVAPYDGDLFNYTISIKFFATCTFLLWNFQIFYNSNEFMDRFLKFNLQYQFQGSFNCNMWYLVR